MSTTRTPQLDAEAIRRVASAHMKRAAMDRTAGEVRFIKDRGGDSKEWAWNPAGASERMIDPDYEFNPKNLEPLAKSLRATLMALGHAQSAYTIFNKIKSQRISPDGSIGGKGYILTIKDIRKLYTNVLEALSAVSDSMYDEMQAVHWNPRVDDSGGDPRDRDEVKQIMDEVEEIREDPEEWAEQEESEADRDDDKVTDGKPRLASADGNIHVQASRLAARYSARRTA